MKYLWTLVFLIGCGHKKELPVVAMMISQDLYRACTSEQCTYCKDSSDDAFAALEKCSRIVLE